MGRPKKSELGPVPTRERLLTKALELFADRGFDAVSVRDIVRPLGLTEATLYIHYDNKAALLDAIFERLEKNLIGPGFRVSPPLELEAPLDVAEYLISGAKRFYDRADRETRLTWRLLMRSQYRYDAARRSVEAHLLDAPCRHFAHLLQNMQEAGAIQSGVDIRAAGRAIAAVFFQYSFRANLDAAWEEDDAGDFERLADELRFVARALETEAR